MLFVRGRPAVALVAASCHRCALRCGLCHVSQEAGTTTGTATLSSNKAHSLSNAAQPLANTATPTPTLTTSSRRRTVVTCAQPPPRPHMTTPGATPGGVDYSERFAAEAELAERHQRLIQRASDAQRRGEEPLMAAATGGSGKGDDEEARWWPPVNENWSGHMFASPLSRNKRRVDGMYVPELKEVPSPERPEELSNAEESFFAGTKWKMVDEVPEQTRRLPPPPAFDPAIDAIDEEGYTDKNVMLDIQRAIEEDKKRMEAFGNPLLVEDQVDYLLGPQRTGQAEMQQRKEFNGFVHWGLLHGAHMILEENHDTKKAHELVNRYMRDMDLFQRWLEHPKVRAHIERKFGVDMHAKYDRLMGLTMAMYTRSKIQVYEDDAPGALKSLTACVTFINNGGDLTKPRHRKALGAVLVARGMVYCKLKSYDRADDDLTRALVFVQANRSPTLFQLRAEAREALGRIDEAREDEERAAEIWEKAEVIRTGADDKEHKFVT